MKNNLLYSSIIALCLLIGASGHAQCSNHESAEVEFDGTQYQTKLVVLDNYLCQTNLTYPGDMPSWISSISYNGSSKTFTIICNPNYSSYLRSYTIYATYNSIPQATIEVTQTCGSNCVYWYADSDGDGYGDYNATATPSNDSNPPFSGAVTNNLDNCPYVYSTSFNGCEYTFENRNWIRSYAYDINGGLKARTIQYYDELGKPTQSQVYDIKGRQAWAQQIFYDFQGRPALSTFSAPVTPSINNVFFGYKELFALDAADYQAPSSITTSEFDSGNLLNPPKIRNNIQYSLGWYYSNSNTSEPFQDITNRPYTRTIYSELRPGEVLRTIGANKVDTDGDGDADDNDNWIQGYTFSMIAGQELSQAAAFGDPVYNNIKTIKTVSRDVHGNEAVIFTDTDGKTLAAARTGGANVRPTTVDISTQGYVDVHIPDGITTGFTIQGVSGINTEVYDLMTEQTTTTATNSLSSGFYRVSITNLDSYNPTSPGTTVTVTCNENYYDYSLNEYDEAGRLIASYQPVGATKNQKPTSTFQYNALGQLLSTTSPDEGTANFKYRKDGQIRFSQNSKQLAASPEEFSYTNYDDLGRPVESGVATGDFSNLNADTSTVTTGIASEKQETRYDDLDSADISSLSGVHSDYVSPSFLAGNVAKTHNINTTTYYSYDVYGRVKWIVQKIPDLGAGAQNFKTIDYTYDPITGLVIEVDYQKHTVSERFIHRYTYDPDDDSLIKVETSTNGTNYNTQANYVYYETGALKQIELAPVSGIPLQTIDYVYNLNGQLKAINPGNDSNDLFSMQIDYHNTDFTRTISGITTHSYGQDRYNGNIKGIRWNNKELENGDHTQERTFSYYYNKNNWLTNAIYGQYVHTPGDGSSINIIDSETYQDVNKAFNATNSITLLPGFYAKPGTGQEVTAKIVTGTPSNFQSGDYNVFDITYDANGNIRTLNRNKHTESNENKMDQLSYNYNPQKPNQLVRVDDAAGEVLPGKDLDDQNGINYEYNQIGQLIKNHKENIEYIYNASGLVTEVKKNSNPLVKFFYNDKGFRVKKESYKSDGSGLDFTEHYVRDVAGTALAIYRDNTVKEYTIYGASRLGVYNKGDGSSYYQLTDHLGNVRAVTGRASDNTPLAIVSTTDYYPFGMPMPNRNNGENSYRYAYQGQEKDPETGKEAFELRLWDARIGRWLTTDPAGQYASPYLGMGNNPVGLIDPDGGFAGPPDWYYNSDTKELEWHEGSNADVADNLTWVGTNGASSEYLSQISKTFGGSGEVPFSFGLYWSGIKRYAEIRGDQIASGKIFGEAMMSAVPGKGLMVNTEAYANNVQTMIWLYETDFGNAEYAYYGGQFTGALGEALVMRGVGKLASGYGLSAFGGRFQGLYLNPSTKGITLFAIQNASKFKNSRWHFRLDLHLKSFPTGNRYTLHTHNGLRNGLSNRQWKFKIEQSSKHLIKF